MAEYTKVALDAMGGDYAPAEIIKGAVDAVSYTHLSGIWSMTVISY